MACDAVSNQKNIVVRRISVLGASSLDTLYYGQVLFCPRFNKMPKFGLTSVHDIDIVHLEVGRRDAERSTSVVAASFLSICVECDRGLVTSIAGGIGGVAIYRERCTASNDIDLQHHVSAT